MDLTNTEYNRAVELLFGQPCIDDELHGVVNTIFETYSWYIDDRSQWYEISEMVGFEKEHLWNYYGLISTNT